MTWFYKDAEMKIEDFGEAVGFVYEIFDLHENKSYIGKKKLWSTRKLKPLKGQKRSRKITKESDWMEYYGSSEEVKALVESSDPSRFRRTILHLCYSTAEMSYLETKEQLVRDVLLYPDKYYNSFVGCRINRMHLKKMIENGS